MQVYKEAKILTARPTIKDQKLNIIYMGLLVLKENFQQVNG